MGWANNNYKLLGLLKKGECWLVPSFDFLTERGRRIRIFYFLYIPHRRWRLSSMLATAFGPFPRFFQFPYILAEGETLPLLREGQSGTTPFRARRLTPLCIPTKVSQTRTSLMHPAASLMWIGYKGGLVIYSYARSFFEPFGMYCPLTIDQIHQTRN